MILKLGIRLIQNLGLYTCFLFHTVGPHSICYVLQYYFKYFPVSQSLWFFGFFLLESEDGTLILPQVGSVHRLQDDDATTITSNESFFSAAEVSSYPLLSNF